MPDESRDPVQWLQSLPTESQLVATILAVGLYYLLRKTVVPISRKFKTPESRYNFRKHASTGLSVVLVLFLALVWIKFTENLAAGLAVVSAGLAIALQAPIVNLCGWLFIRVRGPFELKDRIEIDNDVAGDVVDIRLFMFTILEVGGRLAAEQSTGRIVHIPNGIVFTKRIANYTQGFSYVWNEIPVVVTFESDWQHAHDLLTRIVTEMTSEMVADAEKQVRETSTTFMVYYHRFTPIVWVSVVDIGVCLTLRYLCDARRRRGSEHEIWKAILKAFKQEPTLDFAYPTTRFYDNYREGKPGAGGPPELRDGTTAIGPVEPLMTQPIRIDDPVGPPADIVLQDPDELPREKG